MKKRFLVSLLMTFLLFAVGATSVFAACVDVDGDKYYSTDGDADGEDPCAAADLPMGAKGGEAGKYDQVTIDCAQHADICNVDMVNGGKLNGKNINPGQIEKAGNGVDENADGIDDKLINGPPVDINSYIEKFINILSSVVAGVSVMVLIWGGIMFATAAGSDDKIRKAKKTMLGAIVGLIVALSAWVIVGYVVGNFVG